MIIHVNYLFIMLVFVSSETVKNQLPCIDFAPFYECVQSRNTPLSTALQCLFKQQLKNPAELLVSIVCTIQCCD